MKLSLARTEVARLVQLAAGAVASYTWAFAPRADSDNNKLLLIGGQYFEAKAKAAGFVPAGGAVLVVDTTGAVSGADVAAAYVAAVNGQASNWFTAAAAGAVVTFTAKMVGQQYSVPVAGNMTGAGGTLALGGDPSTPHAMSPLVVFDYTTGAGGENNVVIPNLSSQYRYELDVTIPSQPTGGAAWAARLRMDGLRGDSPVSVRDRVFTAAGVFVTDSDIALCVQSSGVGARAVLQMFRRGGGVSPWVNECVPISTGAAATTDWIRMAGITDVDYTRWVLFFGTSQTVGIALAGVRIVVTRFPW